MLTPSATRWHTSSNSMKQYEANTEYVGLLGLDLQIKVPSTLMLILHRKFVKYVLSMGESYNWTAQHIYKTLNWSMFETNKLTTHWGPGQYAVQAPGAKL